MSPNPTNIILQTFMCSRIVKEYIYEAVRLSHCLSCRSTWSCRPTFHFQLHQQEPGFPFPWPYVRKEKDQNLERKHKRTLRDCRWSGAGVGCRGGGRYVEGCLAFPYLKNLGFLVSKFLGFLVSKFRSCNMSKFTVSKFKQTRSEFPEFQNSQNKF